MKRIIVTVDGGIIQSAMGEDVQIIQLDYDVQNDEDEDVITTTYGDKAYLCLHDATPPKTAKAKEFFADIVQKAEAIEAAWIDRQYLLRSIKAGRTCPRCNNGYLIATADGVVCQWTPCGKEFSSFKEVCIAEWGKVAWGEWLKVHPDFIDLEGSR